MALSYEKFCLVPLRKDKASLMTTVSSSRQLTLNFDPGLTERHARLIDCVRECVLSHRNALKTIAADMDLSQSELSRRLSPSEKDRRNFSLDDLEAYIRTQGDVTPIYYLIEKYLESHDVKKARALDVLAKLMPLVQAALCQVQNEEPSAKAVRAVR